MLRSDLGGLGWCAFVVCALCACSSAAHDGDDDAGDDHGPHLVAIGDPGADTLAGSRAPDTARPASDAGGEIARWEAHIRRAPFRKLVIEVDVMAGFEPASGVVQDVADSLKDVLDKPDGIQVVIDATLEPAGADHTWTRTELEALGNAQLDTSAPDVDRVHVLFLDGRDGGDSVVLGSAWDHLHVAIFKQSLKSQCDRALATSSSALCRGAELTVLLHELGHVIGLTDDGLPMVSDHRDRAQGHHDVDPTSVMYWQYDRDALFDALLDQLQRGEKPRLSFDAHSLEDIRAVREH